MCLIVAQQISLNLISLQSLVLPWSLINVVVPSLDINFIVRPKGFIHLKSNWYYRRTRYDTIGQNVRTFATILTFQINIDVKGA